MLLPKATKKGMILKYVFGLSLFDRVVLVFYWSVRENLELKSRDRFCPCLRIGLELRQVDQVSLETKCFLELLLPWETISLDLNK